MVSLHKPTSADTLIYADQRVEVYKVATSSGYQLTTVRKG